MKTIPLISLVLGLAVTAAPAATTNMINATPPAPTSLGGVAVVGPSAGSFGMLASLTNTARTAVITNLTVVGSLSLTNGPSLNIVGGLYDPYRLIVGWSNGTVPLATNRYWLIATNTAPYPSATFPALNGLKAVICVKNIGSNDMLIFAHDYINPTIAPKGDMIVGPYHLAPSVTTQFVSDGTNWWTF